MTLMNTAIGSDVMFDLIVLWSKRHLNNYQYIEHNFIYSTNKLVFSFVK